MTLPPYSSYILGMKDNILNKRFKYTFHNSVLYIIGINVLIFILVQYSRLSIQGIPLYYSLSLIPSLVKEGWVWQLFTYMFVHANTSHLLLNMLGLLGFGYTIERTLGTREFLLFYLLTGLFSGLMSYLAFAISGANVVLSGASGAIYGVLLLFAVLYPTSRILLFYFIPVKAPLAVLLFFLVSVFSQITGLNDGVAHLTHLFGMLGALIYCPIRFRVNPFKIWSMTMRR